MAGKLRVTLRKSTVSTTRQARGTVRALGLHRIGETVELPDNPSRARHGPRRRATSSRSRRSPEASPRRHAQPCTERGDQS